MRREKTLLGTLRWIGVKNQAKVLTGTSVSTLRKNGRRARLPAAHCPPADEGGGPMSSHSCWHLGSSPLRSRDREGPRQGCGWAFWKTTKCCDFSDSRTSGSNICLGKNSLVVETFNGGR